MYTVSCCICNRKFKARNVTYKICGDPICKKKNSAGVKRIYRRLHWKAYAIRTTAWAKAHPERRAEIRKKYNDTHKEKMHLYNKLYYARIRNDSALYQQYLDRKRRCEARTHRHSLWMRRSSALGICKRYDKYNSEKYKVFYQKNKERLLARGREWRMLKKLKNSISEYLN